MLRVEPSKVHSVKPLFLPGLHNSTGRNPAGLLRPLRAEEAHEPALPGQAGHLRRCASGLEVDGGGKHLAGQGGVLVLDDLIGALEGLPAEVPRHHPQGGEHIHVLRLRALPVKAVQRLGGDGIRPGDQLIELPDKFFFLHLLSPPVHMEVPPMDGPWTGLIPAGQQVYQGFQILRRNPLRRLAQPVESEYGQMLHGDPVEDRTGQGAVHHPEAHLGAVLDAGAAQEPFQPGLAVRQEQQGALPFAGRRPPGACCTPCLRSPGKGPPSR